MKPSQNDSEQDVTSQNWLERARTGWNDVEATLNKRNKAYPPSLWVTMTLVDIQ